MELSSVLPETSVASSRLVQESISLHNGVSAYGQLAVFINDNLEDIDRIAAFAGDVASNFAVQALCKKQYSSSEKDKFSTKTRKFLERNVYIDEEKEQAMSDARALTASVINLGVQVGIGYGARTIGKWANEQDTYITCEQVYCVLKSYIDGADPKANRQKALIELNKIRNSFPISKQKKQTLCRKYNGISVSRNEVDVENILGQPDNLLREATGYFVTVLSRQLYGSDSDMDQIVLSYYGLLGMNSAYGRELHSYDLHSYDEIAMEQNAYLQLSRGLMKNLFKNKPNIDISAIMARSQQLAQYDPYAARKKTFKGVIQGGSDILKGIIQHNPDIAFNGLSTALSQFRRDDETLQTAKDRLADKGINGQDFDTICNTAQIIDSKNRDNDSTEDELC